MHKALIAEELLALFTDRGRAAAIAGDLTEEAGAKGTAWFAAALANVAGALFFCAFAGARGHTLRLLGKGLLVWCALYMGVRIIGALSGVAPRYAADADFAALDLGAQLYLAGALIVAALLAGAVLGARATANGVNAAVPLAMLWLTTAVVAPVWDLAAGTATWYCTILYLTGLPLCYVLPLLTGA
ncbi:MAG: hypothetical protein JXB36_12670, partial [Gammaproteobacteria bacterium]|nr:hypothetical protein [Gammaproteobacteria bacterium]